jgi:hypothetical protein
MAPVDEAKTNGIDLAGAVIRLCPACGVINPAGPSAGCPHVQLIRFDGVPADLAELLARVAEARRQYGELADRLRELALAAVHQGLARVETASERKARSGAADPRPARPAPQRLELTSQLAAVRAGPAPVPAPPVRPRRRGLPPVDARQLDLLARGPAKGEA